MFKKRKKIENKVNTPTKRILLIGDSIKSRDIVSFNWQNIPQGCNSSDFDVIIISMDSFDINNKKCFNNPFILNNFLSNQENELIIIGDKYSPDINHTPISCFLPFFPPLRYYQQPGEAFRELDECLNYFFCHVKKWHSYLETKEKKIPYLLNGRFDGVFERDFIRYPPQSYYIKIKHIANSLAGHPIAFSFFYMIVPTENVQKSSANIIYLPPTTSIPVIEGIKLILKKRFGVTLESDSPEWISKYKLNVQLEIEKNIEDKKERIKEIEMEINKMTEPLKKQKEFQKLLYESGDILKNTVFDAFEVLGAKVDRTDNFKDDGRIEYPLGRKGILEVKGLEKSVKRKDIRQLEDWMDVAKETEKWKGKGLLVANTYINFPLNKRKEPFPDDCKNKATAEGICLITTTQIFKALNNLQEGKLNIQDFWDMIFETNGICSLPEL